MGANFGKFAAKLRDRGNPVVYKIGELYRGVLYAAMNKGTFSL